jgi:pimeloyl-ACP methyl ester carboxylesterase
MSVPLKKPTIIIVHGAFHTPEFFTDLSSRLVSSYQVIAPALPSTSTTPALPNFDQDVQTVREVIRHVVEAEGEDCLLVMHSYGGVVGTEAVKGLEYRGNVGVGRGVVGLVYIAALLLQEGESPYVNGAAWEVPRPEDEGSPVTVEVSVLCTPLVFCRAAHQLTCPAQHQDGLGTALDASSLFYNDLSTETAAYWASKLKLQSMAFVNPFSPSPPSLLI